MCAYVRVHKHRGVKDGHELWDPSDNKEGSIITLLFFATYANTHAKKRSKELTAPTTLHQSSLYSLDAIICIPV